MTRLTIETIDYTYAPQDTKWTLETEHALFTHFVGSAYVTAHRAGSANVLDFVNVYNYEKGESNLKSTDDFVKVVEREFGDFLND